MRIIIIFIFLLASLALSAQLRIVIDELPPNTPPQDTLFIAGNFNNWNPRDPRYILSNQSGQYQIELSLEAGTVQFKITRGSWQTVEGNAAGSARPNRVVQYDGNLQEVEIDIQSWEDLTEKPQSGSTASNVRIISDSFFIPQLQRRRRVWVYLPPDYHQSTKRYPVLYLQDGQNIFDASTSFAGEWQVDESLNQLFEFGDEGLIVVAVDNGGPNRIAEYAPWAHPQYGGGQGSDYAAFLAQTLKTYIDKQYRTRPEREHTGIMGSSMGGMIALYTAITYQEVFGLAGIFSPSLWFSEEIFTYILETGQQKPLRFFLAGGEKESEIMASDLKRLRQALQTAGFNKDNIRLEIHPDGRHAEWYWSREFPAAYYWLYENTPPKDTDAKPAEWAPAVITRPWPESEQFLLLSEINWPLEVQILTANGQAIRRQLLEGKESIDMNTLEEGIYLLRFFINEQLIGTQKIIVR